ncbi:MAG: dihydrolipoyl dehydrogenase family protein [Candidatus Dormibacteria bacterium]
MSSDAGVVVIGGGAAGLSAAQTVAAAGRPVTLVENGRLGGECTWNGCVPSKALIEAARVAHESRQAARLGLRGTEIVADFAAVTARVQRVVESIAGYEDASHLEAQGMTVRRGRARLRSPQSIDVDGQPLSASAVIVCTGGTPAVPPIEGLREAEPHTNETIFGITELPRRLLVLGAGPIGLELAQAFHRLGSEVHVVDVAPALLPTEDAAIAAEASRILTEDGLHFHLDAQVSRVTRDPAGITLHRGGDGEAPLRGDALLVATGRRPRTADLGLEELGVEVGPRGIAVDEHLRTAVPGIYAAGDVTGIMPFTHAAAYQGRVAATNAMGKSRKADHRVIPWAVFIDPPIAHVGLTEAQAREQFGGDVRVATLPMTAVDRAIIDGGTRGLIKVVVRGRPVIGHAGGGEIVGAHAIGLGAADLIHEFALAMQTRAFAGRLAQTVHAYPTLAMGVQQAVAQLFGAGRAAAGEMREELRSLS